MDTKELIKHFAFDCTIGCGKSQDDQDEPQADELDALARILKREPTNDEVETLIKLWRENQTMMAQP